MIKKIYKISKIVLLSIFGLIIALLLVYAGKRIITQDKTSSVFGYSFYYVSTGSMIPDINPGDLIVVKSREEYEVGMDITYQLNKDSTPITHRIVEINDELITTWGINNGGTIDKPFDKDCIVGEVVSIWRNYYGFVDFVTSPLGIILILASIFGVVELVCFLDRKIIKDSNIEEDLK